MNDERFAIFLLIVCFGWAVVVLAMALYFKVIKRK